MALKKCKECKKQVSTKAKICPNCGAPIRKSGLTKPAGCFIIIILIIIIFTAISKRETNIITKTQANKTEKLKI